MDLQHGASASPGNTVATGGATASVQIAPSGGLQLQASSSSTNEGTASVSSAAVTIPAAGVWRAWVGFTLAGVGIGANTFNTAYGHFLVQESSGDSYGIFTSGQFHWAISAGGSGDVYLNAPPVSPQYSLMLESDGEWIWAFFQGALLGVVRRGHVQTTSLQVFLEVIANPPNNSIVLTSTGVLVEAHHPFLMPAAEKGSYALPPAVAAGARAARTPANDALYR